MSQENVELVYRAHDAFNRRDLDAFLALCDPDVEFNSATQTLVEGGGDYHGHDGVRDWWNGLFGFIPDFSSEVVETRDLGDFTIARVRVHGSGVHSGAPMDQLFWQVGESRNEKIIWWRFVLTEADALEAAGLKE